MRFLTKISLYTIAALPLAAQIPPGVPSQYQAIYSTVSTQISAFQTTVNQSWNGKPYAVNWAPHLSTASSDQYMALLAPNYFTNTVLIQLQELQAAGVKAVTVHINFPILYQPFFTYANNPSAYQEFVSFYQQVADAIHSAGMKMIVESTVTEGLDGTEGADYGPYYQTLSWNEFMSDRAQHDVNIAQLVVPDYLTVIAEPDSEATNGYQPTEDSPSGAMQLLDTVLTALQAAKVTNVKRGAGAGTWIQDYTTYLQDFGGTSLDYIDTHVYPVNNNDLMEVLTGAATIAQTGKPMAISEAWADKISNAEVGVLGINTIDSRDAFGFWEPIDQAFLQAMVDFSQYEKLLFFSPSYPNYFSSYLSYIEYGNDTPAEILPAAFANSTTAYRLGAFDSLGVAFSKMIVGTDSTPPATPDAPTLVSESSTGDTLSWTPTTDNIGVAGYNIYRNGVVIATQTVPPFYDTGLTPGVTYTYNLSAFDAQRNVSKQSPPLSVTTIDLSPPSVPTNLRVTGDTQNSVSLSWSASTGGGGVGGYRVLKGNSPSSMSIIAGTVQGTSYTDPYARPSTTYYYSVESYNLLGITSEPCSPVSVTTP